MVQVLGSEEDKYGCPLHVSVPPLRKPLAEYNLMYIQFSQQGSGSSHQLCEYPWSLFQTKAEIKELIE